MHKEFHHDAVRRLQALIERETGKPLGEAAQAEMAGILHGMENPEGALWSWRRLEPAGSRHDAR